MEKMLFYDCEVIRLIEKNHKYQDLEYCSGWRDFENMGISVIGVYITDGFFDKNGFEYREGSGVFRNLGNLIPFDFPEFKLLLSQAEVVIGFNSRSFDDQVLAANQIEVTTQYDLLELIRLAAYGSTNWKNQPQGFSYSLDTIAKANGLAKIGRGDLAPIWWQQGRRKEVIEYCLRDVEITKTIWDKALQGTLLDPNTNQNINISQFIK